MIAEPDVAQWQCSCLLSKSVDCYKPVQASIDLAINIARAIVKVKGGSKDLGILQTAIEEYRQDMDTSKARIARPALSF